MKNACFWVLFALFLCQVHGEVIPVTSLNDNGPGSLRQALTSAKAGDIIGIVVEGRIRLISGEMVINTNITIRGLGPSRITIDGDRRSRIFQVNRGTVLIEGIRFENGHVTLQDGGAIRNRGTLKLVNCQFYGNRTSEATTVSQPWIAGGAVSNDGTLEVVQCLFENNQAEGFLRDNWTNTDGGAIFNLGDLKVSNSIFRNNSAYEIGGAIYSNFTTTEARIEFCTFEGNEAGYGGGAIHSGASMSIKYCEFLKNSATNTAAPNYSYGGAIINSTKLDIVGSVFVENTAESGGALSSNFGLQILPTPEPKHSKVRVLNSTFSGNTALTYGGALLNVETTDLSVEYSTITLNSAKVGGGIINRVGAMASLNNALVAGNKAVGDIAELDTNRFNNAILFGAGPDLSGIYTSHGFNLVQATAGYVLAPRMVTDIIGKEALLAKINDNGGPTLTHALLEGSPALDSGFSGSLLLDQRLRPRPVDNPLISNVLTGDSGDIGAFEKSPDEDQDDLPDEYEIRHGLDPENDSDAQKDLDNDGATNTAEFLAQTDPADSSSVFKITRVERLNDGWKIHFTSVIGQRYLVEKSSSLAESDWEPVSGIVVASETTSQIEDWDPLGSQKRFFRIRLLQKPGF